MMRIRRFFLVVLIPGLFTCFAIARQSTPPPADQDPSLAKPERHKFTAAQAKAVALDAVDGTVVGDPVFKHDGGYWVYIVSVKTTKDTKRVWVDSDTDRIVGIDTAGNKKGKGSSAVKNLKKKVDQSLKKSKKRRKKSHRKIIVIR